MLKENIIKDDKVKENNKEIKEIIHIQVIEEFIV